LGAGDSIVFVMPTYRGMPVNVYSFSHNHGSGKWLYLKGNYHWTIFDFHDYGRKCIIIVSLDIFVFEDYHICHASIDIPSSNAIKSVFFPVQMVDMFSA